MRYSTEMWDKMQHIMENYNDHMVHVNIRFDGMLDVDLIKKAVWNIVDKIPVLKSVFIPGILQAEWVTIEEIGIDDIFEFRTVEGDPQEISEAFLVQKIRETREAQIKVLLVRHDGKDTLNFLINHQCFDGADLKWFLYYVAQSYNGLLAGGDGAVNVKSGTRSEMQLYKDFTPEQREEAFRLISYSKKTKAKIHYPFETRSLRHTKPKFVKYDIDPETFVKLKQNSKKLGVSINDIILGCFYRATLKMVEIKEGETLGIPNMVDLRRYIKGGQSAGMCNLTSMVVPNLGDEIGDSVFETVVRSKVNMDQLKAYYPGLHGIPLLRKVFQYAPYALAHFLIGTFFKNPLIGISNIGIVDDQKMKFNGVDVEGMFLSGSIKYPPYMQLALSTFRNRITHTVAIYGTPKDYEMFETMYRYYDEGIREIADTDQIPADVLEKCREVLEKAAQ